MTNPTFGAFGHDGITRVSDLRGLLLHLVLSLVLMPRIPHVALTVYSTMEYGLVFEDMLVQQASAFPPRSLLFLPYDEQQLNETARVA